MKNTGNGTYHSGEKAIKRVREWRKANPGYWRRQKGAQSAENNNHQTSVMLHSVLTEFVLQDIYPALQDSWRPHVAALVGLIGWIRGSTLQDTIARDLREIMLAGYAILKAPRPKHKNTSRP